MPRQTATAARPTLSRVPKQLNGTTSGSASGRPFRRTCTLQQRPSVSKNTSDQLERCSRTSRRTPARKRTHNGMATAQEAVAAFDRQTHFLGSQRRGSATSSVRSYCSSRSLISRFDCSSTTAGGIQNVGKQQSFQRSAHESLCVNNTAARSAWCRCGRCYESHFW